MMGPNRRRFLQSMLAVSAGALVYARPARPGFSQPRVVVVGNGVGGRAFVQAMNRLCPTSRLTCIDPQARQGRHNQLEYIAGRVVEMGFDRKYVRIENGMIAGYDALVLAPGADIHWGKIEGYTATAAEQMPHGWIGADRGAGLQARLRALPQGATVIVYVPGGVIRFPQAVNLRIRQVSSYLRQHKSRSKLLVLDARQNPREGRYAADNVEWIVIASGSDSVRVDTDAAALHIAGTTYRGDLVNFIPPQQAGELAHRHSLVDASGWCPVDVSNSSSSRADDVYVLGDSSTADAGEKSGLSATKQAINCASHLAGMTHSASGSY
jgi:sulfide dehydrogenase [flavocytochrome c] flavoprotein subunit